jgi:hypothetical protein
LSLNVRERPEASYVTEQVGLEQELSWPLVL